VCLVETGSVVCPAQRALKVSLVSRVYLDCPDRRETVGTRETQDPKEVRVHEECLARMDHPV